MKKIKFILKGEEFNKGGKIENIHEHLQEVKRGTGGAEGFLSGIRCNDWRGRMPSSGKIYHM